MNAQCQPRCLYIAAPDRRPRTIGETARAPVGAPAATRTFFFDDVIDPELRASSYQVELACHVGVAVFAMQEMVQKLLDYELVIIDLTGANSQICLDLGRREMTGRPLLVVKEATYDLPPGFQHLNPIEYSATDSLLTGEGRQRFRHELAGLCRDDRAGRPLFHLLGKPLRIGDISITRQDLDILEGSQQRSRAQGGAQQRRSPAFVRWSCDRA